MFGPLIDTIMTKSTFRAFRHRNFAIVEGAGWLAGAGVWFYRIGLGVFAWELTKSGFWLGVIAIAEAVGATSDKVSAAARVGVMSTLAESAVVPSSF